MDISNLFFTTNGPVDPEVYESYTDATHYRSRGAIDLTFETVHPDQEEGNIVFALISPKQSVLTVIPKAHPMNPIHRSVLHSHDFFELLFVIRGEVYQNIEYERHLYTRGSLCLMNKNIHHSEEFSTDYRALFVMLSKELVQSLFLGQDYLFGEEKKFEGNQVFEFFRNNTGSNDSGAMEYLDFIPIDESKECYDRMYSYFERMVTVFLSPDLGSSFEIRSILLELFETLSDSGSYSTIPIHFGSEKELGIFNRVRNALASTNGRLSRSDLSKRLNYSGSYLNSLCKKYSGLSLFDYGMNICMKEATKLLDSTDMNVAEISEHLGFTNRSHFYSIFREHYGVSPAQYRKRDSD
ncbi:MAG: AraC family transcriptional regulator [Butyrivibrio sp.]|nr:AraC family transcriptional regulator [Butyrivibrio sp.]